MTGTVAVVGGGCSGAFMVRELLQRGGTRVVFVDPARRQGLGVAYGAAAPWHVLNSPASAMSAYPDDPGHFVQWCRRQGLDVRPTDFVSRPSYGDYLLDVLQAADVAAPGRLIRRRARAVRVRPESGYRPGARVALDDGSTITADRVVLALGQAPPADPPGLDPRLRTHPRYVANPWSPGALTALPADEPVLLLGAGLTAIDVALTLVSQGHRAPLRAVSRHGLLPQPHRSPQAPQASSTAPAGPWLPAATPELSDLVRTVRRLAATVPDWRVVIDGLRPRLDTLWNGLSPQAQRRFLNHLARYWEVHRHRMAPPVAKEIARLRDEGALSIQAATVEELAPMGTQAVQVTIRPRGGVPARAQFGAVVNCTGPGCLPAHGDALVQGLVADGLTRPGPHGLGLDVTTDGALIGRDGRPSDLLWTLGPPRRGLLWETTAVPEIRAQAWALAAMLAEVDIPALAIPA